MNVLIGVLIGILTGAGGGIVWDTKPLYRIIFACVCCAGLLALSRVETQHFYTALFTCFGIGFVAMRLILRAHRRSQSDSE